MAVGINTFCLNNSRSEQFSKQNTIWCHLPLRNEEFTLEAIFKLRKDIEVGGWSRKWQFSLSLCSEISLPRWVGGSKKPQNTLT